MQGCDRGAKCARQNIPGVCTRVLMRLGEGKVETQGQELFVRQPILQMFQHRVIEIGIRVVGDYHRDALTRRPPFGNAQNRGNRLVTVNRFGERDLNLFELCALLDHETPLGIHRIARIRWRKFLRIGILDKMDRLGSHTLG